MAQTGLSRKRQPPPPQTVVFSDPTPGSALAADDALGPASSAAPHSAPPDLRGNSLPASDSLTRCAAAPRCIDAQFGQTPAPLPANSPAPLHPVPPAASGASARSVRSPPGNAA